MPRFRKNNSVLDNVKRRPSIFFNKLGSLLENKFIEAIGVIITALIAGGVISQLGSYIEKNIVPIVDQMSLMHKVLYMAILVWVINLLFKLLGFAAKNFFGLLKKLWIKIVINSDNDSSD